jgi:hypothetical protein
LLLSFSHSSFVIKGTYFLFLRHAFCLPPVALRLWRESREIPAKIEKQSFHQFIDDPDDYGKGRAYVYARNNQHSSMSALY